MAIDDADYIAGLQSVLPVVEANLNPYSVPCTRRLFTLCLHLSDNLESEPEYKSCVGQLTVISLGQPIRWNP